MTDLFRPPAVAGQFYPRNGEDLAHQLEACFRSPRGPGELPARQRRPDRHIRAVIVPHAGYVYSGAIAALAYWAIAAERPPAHVLILGVDHHGTSSTAALSDRGWSTPLGPVPVDTELMESLRHSPIVVDEAAHRLEHSIEVQLPFLEYVLPKPRFVALMVPFGPFSFLEEVAGVIRRALVGRDVLLIASTDFSHYVPADVAKRLDHLAIEEILQGRSEGLYSTVTGHDISMCGIAPTATLLAALEGETLTTKLLRWGHSGEVETMREVVGYASLLLESEAPLPEESAHRRVK
jgi:AmmeMemoRadiSam system protein B